MVEPPPTQTHQNETVPDNRSTNQVRESSNTSSTTNRRIRAPRKCGICGNIGRDRCTCPEIPNQTSQNQNAVHGRQRNATNTQPRNVIPPPTKINVIMLFLI